MEKELCAHCGSDLNVTDYHGEQVCSDCRNEMETERVECAAAECESDDFIDANM